MWYLENIINDVIHELSQKATALMIFQLQVVWSMHTAVRIKTVNPINEIADAILSLV